MAGFDAGRSDGRVPVTSALEQALGTVSDVVCQIDAEGRVVWMSPSVVEVLGEQPADLVGVNMLDRVHPDDLGRAADARRAVLAGESRELVVRHRMASGKYREVLTRTRPLFSEGRVIGQLMTFRDDREARASTSALATVLAGNEVLVRATSAGELLQDMCEAIVTAGDYAFAWFGVAIDDEARTVQPVAVAGDDQGYVASITVSWDAGAPSGRGPTGTAIRAGMTQVRNDLSADPLFRPWFDAATSRGIHSSIALPVTVDGRAHGALTVYAHDVGAFGDTAQQMLENLAADLGFGLDRLTDVERRLLAEQRFRLMAENSTDVVFSADNRLVWRWVSPSAATVLGWAPEELVGRSGSEFLHPADLAELQRALAGATPAAALRMRLRFRRPDGSYSWVSAAGRGIVGGDGREVGRVVAMRDINAEVAAEQAIVRSEAQFRLIAENALDIVIRTELDSGITWASPSLSEVLRRNPDDVVGSKARSWIHPDDVHDTLEARDQAIDSGADVALFEARVQDQQSEWRWMRVVDRVLRDAAGTPTGDILTLRDIDAEMRSRLRAAFDARHDSLTGLLNRAGFLALLEDALAGPGQNVAVLTVGVDSLKAINDAFTHSAGDRALVEVADRLVATVGGGEQVARSADNEFSILARQTDADTLTDLASRLRDAGSCLVSVGSQEITVTVSVGVALGEDRQTGELIRDASTALHQALDLGGNRWEFLDPAIAASARRRLTVQTGLKEAVRTTAIQAWFQPIVSLADSELRGYEALVRWVREDGTIVLPDDFLPVAEQSDLIVTLDHSVLAQALGVLVHLPEPQHVAVNISAPTLIDAKLLATLRSELDRAHANPARLHLEVTETSLVRATPDVLRVMRDIADLGVTWWVDDFGTGYSSIAHLRDMPIGGLKLDRTFTSGVTVSASTDQRLAQGLLGLAQGLGLRTVAEGVETQEQADQLVAQGWELGQGWLYGRPAPLAEATHVAAGAGSARSSAGGRFRPRS